MSVNFFLEAISKMHFTTKGRVTIMLRLLESKQVAVCPLPRLPVLICAVSDFTGERENRLTGTTYFALERLCAMAHKLLSLRQLFWLHQYSFDNFDFPW